MLLQISQCKLLQNNDNITAENESQASYFTGRIRTLPEALEHFYTSQIFPFKGSLLINMTTEVLKC